MDEKFVVYSASGCMGKEYKLGLLELREGGNPLNAGDWKKYSEPLWKWRDGANGAPGVFGPAHNAILFKSPDGTEWWHVYHATENSNGSCYIDRTTRAQKNNWNVDGTRDFGVPALVTEELAVPSGE